jgi:hypothetical protein
MRSFVNRALMSGALMVSACAGASSESPRNTAASGQGHAVTADESDAQLRDLASHGAVEGEAGDRARFDLVSAQIRAYVRALVRARRGAGSAHAHTGELSGNTGDTGNAGFRPSRVLVEQLGVQRSCALGEDADDCAGAIGDALVSRVELFEPSPANAGLKDSLFAALAPFQPNAVTLPPQARWRVLSTGNDPAARLAQAFSLVSVRQRVSEAAARHPGAAESAQLLARVAGELGMGPCAEIFTRLAAASDDATVRAAVNGFATAGCVPECARAALVAGGDDPIAAAANACASSREPVAFGTYEPAVEALETFSRAATSRLAAVTDDPFVTEVLSVTPRDDAAALAAPAPAFLARRGSVVLVPNVQSTQLSGPAIASVSQLVWVPVNGDVWVGPPPVVSAAWDAPPALQLRDVPVSALASTVHPRADAPPIAFVWDAHAKSTRMSPVLAALSPAEGSTDAVITAFTVRHGATTRYVPMRVLRRLPDVVFRIGEHEAWMIDRGLVARSGQLGAMPSAGTADSLGGAIPESRPTGDIGIAFEPDVTGATAARALDAVLALNTTSDEASFIALTSEPATSARVSGQNLSHGPRVHEVIAAVDSHRDEVTQRCLANVAALPDGAQPRIDLHIALGPQGQVSGVGTTQNSPTLASVGRCITRLARTWHVPGLGDRADVHAVYWGPEGVAGAATTATSAAPASSVAPGSANH